MTRISELPLDDWDPELRALSRADAAPPMVLQRLSVTAHAPHMAKAIIAFKSEVARGRLLSPRLVAILAADGQHQFELGTGDSVTVRRSPHPVRLIQLEGYSFFSTLRQKFGWSGSHVEK